MTAARTESRARMVTRSHASGVRLMQSISPSVAAESVRITMRPLPLGLGWPQGAEWFVVGALHGSWSM